MEIKGVGKLLRIYVGADDRLRGKPLFEAIVLQLREIGLAGATALRGIEGYGAGSRVVHTARLLRLSEDLPILVEVVDSEERIEQAVGEIPIPLHFSDKLYELRHAVHLVHQRIAAKA